MSPRSYERWVGHAVQPALSPRGMRRLAALAGLAFGAAVSVLASGWNGLAPAAILLGSFVVILVFYLVAWHVIVIAAHRSLLRRERLSDVARLAAFMAVFIGFPILTIVVPVGILLLVRGPSQ